MTFKEIKYKKFSFPLSTPFQNSSQTINKKDIIIIRATDEFGNYHYGEVGPLGGFSAESIDECETELKNIFKKSIIDINELKKTIKYYEGFPSLLFGLEQLVFSAEKNEFNEVLDSNKSLKINGLIGFINSENVISKIGNYVDRDFETIKIKIGRETFLDDLNILRNIDKEFGSTIKLRIDNNGSWTLDEAVINVKQLEQFNIEYIEQPVEDFNELVELANNVTLPIAADECIKTYDDAIKMIDSGNITYIVLKPTIRLGLFDTMKIIQFANEKDVKVIISSAFETRIARKILVSLASLTKHNLAHGLGTDLLGEELFSTSNNITSPIITNNDTMFKSNLNIDFS